MELGTLLLVLLGLFLALLFGYLLGRFLTEQRLHMEWEAQIPELRKDAIARSRAGLGGKFSENLAPYLPDFPFSPTELRWLGNPVDFIIFKGLDHDAIDEIVFLEMKSGKSQLTLREKQIKNIIAQQRVSWKEYRVPEKITDIRDPAQ